MARRRTEDGSYVWRLYDEAERVVAVIGLSQPTDPLPVFVSDTGGALVGSRVQSVSASDGASRVRIDATGIPFAVGGVNVNHGDGFDMLRIFSSDPDDRKPVVVFRLDQDTLKRKELSFNVI